MGAMALNHVQGKNSPQFAERLARTPGQIKTGCVGAVYGVYIVVAGHKGEKRSRLGTVTKKIDEFRPLGAGSRVSDIAGDKDAFERRFSVDRGKLAKRVQDAAVASWAVRAGLHSIAIALTH